MANSLVLTGLWRAVASDASLVAGEGGHEVQEFKAIGRALVPGIGLYVVATGIALVAPTVGVWSYLLIALVLVVRVYYRNEPGY